MSRVSRSASHFRVIFAAGIVLLLMIASCISRRAPVDFDYSQITLIPTIPEPPTPTPYIFGLILSGKYNDRGWNQAHYLGGTYVEAKVADTKMIYAEGALSTAGDAAQNLVAQGAQLLIFTSKEMADAAMAFAQANPSIYVIIIGGDQAWSRGKHYAAMPNVSNLYGRMEYGQMIAGCAAALNTESGQIGYVTSSPSDETRRLAASAYLGARYCWRNHRLQNLSQMNFRVAWITGIDTFQVANGLYANGYDVLISGPGVDEIASAAQVYVDSGLPAWYIPYASISMCEQTSHICLGAPYFNWGPAYVTAIKSTMDGNWQSTFRWNGPDWADINESETSAVGFVKGAALSPQAKAALERFIEELAFGLNLWSGPINLQDGSVYLPQGQAANDEQIWYLPQLLEGMRE